MPTDEYIKQRSCTGKELYMDRKEARRAARRMLRVHGEKVRPYACPHCKRYHIGHFTPSAERYGGGA